MKYFEKHNISKSASKNIIGYALPKFSTPVESERAHKFFRDELVSFILDLFDEDRLESTLKDREIFLDFIKIQFSNQDEGMGMSHIQNSICYILLKRIFCLFKLYVHAIFYTIDCSCTKSCFCY